MSAIKKFLLPMIAFAVAAFGLTIASPAGAAPPHPCEIPSSVGCEISHPDGIQRVYVKAELGNLFDKTYVDCPETVPISFDAVTPLFEIVIVPCESMGVNPDGDPRDRDDRDHRNDLKPDGGGTAAGVDAYTEYCLKKYPFDPEKAYECSAGWIVD